MSAVRRTAAAEPRRCLPPLTPVRRTQGRLPPGSVDTHCHVFAPVAAHPLDPARGYTPAIVTINDYRAAMQAYGIDRAVAGSTQRLRFRQWRAVCSTGSDAGRAARRRRNSSRCTRRAVCRSASARRARRARQSAQPGRPGDARCAAPCRAHRAARLAHPAAGRDRRSCRTWRRCRSATGLPIVIDHFGFPDLSLGAGGRAFASLVELAASGLCFVKLSAPYRIAGAPDRYRLLQPFVERLVEHAADQLLWALDWPHTECYAAVPDDGPLLGLLGDWLPTPDLQRKVLCDNPARLYWEAPRQQSGSRKE